MSSSIAVLAAALLGASEVWFAGAAAPLAPVATGEGDLVLDAAKVYAAQGEREGYLCWIRAGRGGFEALRLVPAEFDGTTVSVYLLAPPHAAPGESESPPASAPWDLLAPAKTVDLEAGEQAAFYVEYAVAPDAAPGIAHGRQALQSANKRTLRQPVRLEVFDFRLPDAPALPVVVPLNRAAAAQQLGLPGDAVEAWQPLYETLGQYRVSAGIWDGGPLVQITPEGGVDASALRAHLAAYVEAGQPAVVDIGGNGRALQRIEAPREGERDLLRVFLSDMSAWLARQGWLERAYVEPRPLPARPEWHAARAALVRMREADPFLPRMVVGPPHPFFEGYVERWALPFDQVVPGLLERWREGLSVAVEKQADARAVQASSANTDHPPQDAFDGSALTEWQSLVPPAPGAWPWYEVAFAAPTTVQDFTVVWGAGQPPRDLEVLTAFPNGPLQPSSARWEHRAPYTPRGRAWSEVRLRYAKTIRALRLDARGLSQPRPMAIAEISFGAHNAAAAAEERRPLSPWLHVLPGQFPRLDMGSHAAEARLVPWLCHLYGFEGVVYDNLNDWAQSGIATATTTGHLLYPGDAGVRPSLRAIRLRDGIDDFDYLKALQAALEDGHIEPERARELVPAEAFDPQPPDAQLDAWAARMPRAKMALGRALSRVPAAQ